MSDSGYEKVLAEDLRLENMVKIGLSHEQTQSKSDQIARAGTKAEDASVRRVFQEELKQLNFRVSVTNIQEKKTKCQTCIRSYSPGFFCPSKKSQKCFDCGEGGHFKELPSAKSQIVRKIILLRRPPRMLEIRRLDM